LTETFKKERGLYMTKKVSIKEIAKLANVSIATVSYALNNSKEVSATTRAHVLKIANELNYVPNVSARNLRTQKSKLICAMVNDFGSPFNGAVLQTMQEQFELKGYQLVVISGQIPDIINTNLFDGTLILNYRTPESEIRRMADNGVPIILLANEIEHPNISSVLINNDTGIKQLMQLYAKSPHQKIAFLTGDNNSYNSQDRQKFSETYYRQIFKRDDFLSHVYPAGFSVDLGYEVGYKLLKEGYYNAFFCFNDGMATGVYQAARELGIEVGTEISVSGFDDSPIAKTLLPSLTTVQIDKKSWGHEAVKNYLALRENKKMPEKKRIETTLVIRDSVRYSL
jgi:LacI family transcriptional regulator